MRVFNGIAAFGYTFSHVMTLATATLHHEHVHAHARRGALPVSQNSVFCHYMNSIPPPQNDYTNDINLAKSAGIDAFAVNYGGDGNNFDFFSNQLDNMFKTAETLSYKLFLSFDMTSVSSKDQIVNLTNFYATSPAYAKDSNGKILLSTFQTGPPPWNWNDVISQIKVPVTFLPGTLSESVQWSESNAPDFGPFTWVHPASDPTGEKDIDAAYANASASTGLPWMAGVAAWFFKRMSPDQNWLHAQDSYIWIDRWMHLLKMKPSYIEILTWNDFGESHYIGPADSTAQSVLTQPTTKAYYGNLDHSAFLKMAAIFIKNFKAGNDHVVVDPSDEDVFMFHRLQPVNQKGTNSLYPDNAWDLPENSSYIDNNVYIVPFLASPATIYLSSGGNPWQMDAPAGVSKGTVAWSLGNQTLTASRPINGQTLRKSGPEIVASMDRYNGNVVAI